MASTDDETGRFFFIGLLIGVVFSVLAVIQIFTEGGRISLIMLAFWPLVLAGIGGWIDGKRRKSKGKDDQTPTS